MALARYLIFGDLHGRILPALRLAMRWEREHGSRLDGLLQVGELGYFPTSPRSIRPPHAMPPTIRWNWGPLGGGTQSAPKPQNPKTPKPHFNYERKSKWTMVPMDEAFKILDEAAF